ncbi:MAG: ABC transporter ATP-binding protein [Pirellulales bacterium]
MSDSTTSPADVLQRKSRTFAAQLRLLPAALGMVWQSARRWFLLWTTLVILQGLLPIGLVYATKVLVDRLTADTWAWQTLAGPVAVIAAVMLLTEALRVWANYVQTVQADLLHEYISARVHAKSARVGLSFYELPEFFDHLHRAQSEALYRPAMLLESLGSLLQHGITLTAMVALLLTYTVWLPLALVLSTAPAFWVVLRHAVQQHLLRERSTPDQRRARYYDWVLTAPETAAELRLFDLSGHFQTLYAETRRKLYREAHRLARRRSAADLGASAIGLVAGGGAFAWILVRAARGQASLGDLAFFYQAFAYGQRMMHALLQQVGQLYYNSLFLSSLHEFLSLPDESPSQPLEPAPPRLLREGIRFEGIAFRYPGSERQALCGLNFVIPAGRNVALVGPNGSGKSSIVKLLCRFYDPDQGRITFDGVDLRELPLAEVRRQATVLFQQPVHYQATVTENIGYGSWQGKPSAAEVVEAVEAAGAEGIVAELPGGYQQFLGKWFVNGTELSAGQWQRIALARAYLRKSPLLILDEPTSAMDPWAEAEWVGRFRELAAGRTAVLITHRFPIARHADLIYVVDQGRIVEAGTHEELLQSGGLYAESWRAQTQEEGLRTP